MSRRLSGLDHALGAIESMKTHMKASAGLGLEGLDARRLLPKVSESLRNIQKLKGLPWPATCMFVGTTERSRAFLS
jgi:hypothetical protein